jgi:hypothetical protein
MRSRRSSCRLVRRNRSTRLTSNMLSQTRPLQFFLLKNRDPARWRDAWQLEHVIGKYVISHKPLTEAKWIKQIGATVIEGEATDVRPSRSRTRAAITNLIRSQARLRRPPQNKADLHMVHSLPRAVRMKAEVERLMKATKNNGPWDATMILVAYRAAGASSAGALLADKKLRLLSISGAKWSQARSIFR